VWPLPLSPHRLRQVRRLPSTLSGGNKWTRSNGVVDLLPPLSMNRLGVRPTASDRARAVWTVEKRTGASTSSCGGKVGGASR
jgi:hypothetical protein